jgi:hypothetical protein
VSTQRQHAATARRNAHRRILGHAPVSTSTSDWITMESRSSGLVGGGVLRGRERTSLDVASPTHAEPALLCHRCTRACVLRARPSQSNRLSAMPAGPSKKRRKSTEPCRRTREEVFQTQHQHGTRFWPHRCAANEPRHARHAKPHTSSDMHPNALLWRVRTLLSWASACVSQRWAHLARDVLHRALDDASYADRATGSSSQT